jgi:tetratricopeptide (TPR) repeat protein
MRLRGATRPGAGTTGFATGARSGHHARVPQPLKTSSPRRAGRARFAALALLVLALGAALALWFIHGGARFSSGAAVPSRPDSGADAAVFAAYGTSPTCKSCHEEAFANWLLSHHALAERDVAPALDDIAFDPPWTIRHGTQRSEARKDGARFVLVTQGPGGTNQPFEAQRVIGVEPLRQYLIPFGNGRWQSSELAFDPRHPGWFNVFGEEDRRPGEWGHWTGRGMNWNSMCATCHNTRLRKNYDERTDSYTTRMAEMGVGCEACHGPMADHNAWQAKHPNQKGDPTLRKLSREQMLSVCAQCHSRRAELTGDFVPGDDFLDHHQLTLVDETELFYPDGQIRDEDYEYAAFLGSRMHAAGVRCMDCHEPHRAKPRVAGNLLCLSCHGTVTNSAPRIDPETHSRHKPGTRGDFCVDCHMPQTVYMQRHARRDHGFTVPDPRLTLELGIPNACNRCHTERSAQWALEFITQWYGPRTNDLVLQRARAVARARQGDRTAVEPLLQMLRGETNGYWRAVAANLLKYWAGEASVTAALLAALSDTNALVRAMAVRGLEPTVNSGQAAVMTALRARLDDPVRAVRVEAAWALRHSLDTNTTAGRDLLAYLRHNFDQPAGALQMGIFLMDRGDAAAAAGYFERAVRWDPHSAPLFHALAVALGALGRPAEAVKALETACELAPREAEYRFKLGLALNEVGRLADAAAALEEATRLEPGHARAWYNLGLARSALGRPEAALEALVHAESLDPHAAEFPYARATVLARLGRMEEARRAAERALELNPGFTEARRLLQSLGR